MLSITASTGEPSNQAREGDGNHSTFARPEQHYRTLGALGDEGHLARALIFKRVSWPRRISEILRINTKCGLAVVIVGQGEVDT